MESISTAATVEAEVRHNYRHNFLFLVLDGTFFWFGFTMISASVILPLFVSHFTQNPLMLGLIPALGSAGFLVPQLFTARWVESLPLKKVLPVNYGLFTERIPVLLMAPATWLLAERAPALMPLVVLLLYGWSSAGAGLVAVGWQDMVAKVIPVERRGFFFGLTNFCGTVAGAVGAAFAAWLLGRFAFPHGFTIAFACSGVLTMLSWYTLTLIREPAVPSQPRSASQLEFFRSLPRILRMDKNFSRYLASQVILSVGAMAAGFLIVEAVQRWNLSDQKAGTFSVAMLILQAAANLFFGWLGDKRGYKAVLELTALLAALSMLLAALAPSPEWFYVVFALRGAVFAGGYMGASMIGLEFSHASIRPTYIGLNNTLPGVVSSLAPLFAGALAGWMGYRGLFLLTVIFSAASFVMLRLMVREPRSLPQADGISPAQPPPGAR